MALISNGTTVASGGSVTVSSSAVGSATASLTGNSVGSYIAAQRFVNRTDTMNATESGSNMNASSFGGGSNGPTLSGTWRVMGYRNYNTNNYSYQSTLYLRIS